MKYISSRKKDEKSSASMNEFERITAEEEELIDKNSQIEAIDRLFSISAISMQLWLYVSSLLIIFISTVFWKKKTKTKEIVDER